MSIKKIIPVIATIVLIIFWTLLIRGCMGRNTLNKDQIIQFVLDNEELLNQAVEEIWGLDNHIHVVANTRFRPRPGTDFEGLYTSGTLDGQNVTKPLDNSILYELLRDGRIRRIGISRPNPHRGTTYQIQFAFNVRSARYRHGGIYFSRNDEPILFDGVRWRNPEEYRDGWVSYGYNFYYTERVVPHWFYYEMLFRSTRRPQR
ncbi:MAG: hypothetical protein FWC92_07250 [Defluviitaleaceae bacterium]|nr:hypothetical protein [Defluviitaleaceae bacterium]